jgi:hypothetical protein
MAANSPQAAHGRGHQGAGGKRGLTGPDSRPDTPLGQAVGPR